MLSRGRRRGRRSCKCKCKLRWPDGVPSGGCFADGKVLTPPSILRLGKGSPALWSPGQLALGSLGFACWCKAVTAREALVTSSRGHDCEALHGAGSSAVLLMEDSDVQDWNE
jgi:hypothetical protein